MPESSPDTPSPAAGQFRTTHWSVVVRAGHGQSSEAGLALNELCQVYWYPLYAFARRQGHSASEAEDLTQAFSGRLLERNFVAKADPEKGRFRTFLLTLFRRFLASEWDRQHMQKRGGFQTSISLDAAWAESRYGAEPVHGEPPDRLFDRQWAQTLLDQVMHQLKSEYLASGRARLFERLEACLTRDETALRYTEIAAELGLTEAAVKIMRSLHRFRTVINAFVEKIPATRIPARYHRPLANVGCLCFLLLLAFGGGGRGPRGG